MTFRKHVEELIATASIYGEGVGGLGDVLLRLYFSGEAWYTPLASLAPRSHAVFVLMCHNPYASEIFKWHPNRKQIHVVDLGFTTSFHPWENREWRVAHGLPPEAPCPPYAPSKTIRFYPSASDVEFLEKINGDGPYVILAATAGDPRKSLPEDVCVSIARRTVESKIQVVVVGRSMYLARAGRTVDLKPSQGVVDATDRLSVPGMIEAVKGAVGVISADTSVLHAAWQEHRPVFLLYNRWTQENLIPRGPVGYMQGIDRPDTDHMEFGAYFVERYEKWLLARC